MNKITLAATALLSVAAASSASAQVFTPIGGNSTRPTNMSPDGAWLTGVDFNGYFRWEKSSATFDLFTTGAFNGQPDIAMGGSPVAVTISNTNGDEEAGLWTPTGTTLLGGLGGQSGTSISSSYGCNGDGTVTVGLGWINAGSAHAFRWNGSMVDLGSVGGNSSRANDVSHDGMVTVGWDEDPTGFRRASYWVGTNPGTIITGNPGETWGASTDGRYLCGIDSDNAFRYDTVSSTFLNLGKLPGSVGGDDAFAQGVSDDGNTVVGFNGNNFFGTPFRAFIWRPGAGMVVVQDLVTALGGTIPVGFADLSIAAAVSTDGNTISGQSGAFPFGPFEGWVFEIPPVASTYCTGKVNSQGCLTAIDFDGTPSASSGAGFDVGASNIIPGANGILFYSTTGPAATPFQGGFLCVSSPTTRTAVQVSGGAAPCSGTFSFDFNAYVATGFDTNLVGGADVWAQYWSRDPASPSTTNLTDAVTFTLWP